MMVLRIDGVDIPLVDSDVNLPLFRASKMRSVAAWREDERLEFRIPATATIAQMLGHAEELYTDGDFNSEQHDGQLFVDGVLLFTGIVSLVAVERGPECVYRIALRSGGDSWANEAALTLLNESGLKGERMMTFSSIFESWSDDGVVRLLPMCRDGYVEADDTGVFVPQRTLLPQEYFPFLSVKAIIEKLIEGSGYTLCSDFLSSPLVERLMISGAYRGVEMAQALATMEFKALRRFSASATASQIGRVDAWGPVGGSYVGYVVDTVDPTALDESGVACSDAFAMGGCFRFENGRPKFYPKREIRTAFDIHLRYTTDYRIASSTRLVGFDKLYLGNECYVNIDLINNFRDQRDKVITGIEYTLIIFDYDASNSYYLGSYGVVRGNVAKVKFTNSVSGPVKVYVKPSGEDAYTHFYGDWALYDGYVEAEGRREVEVNIRTPYEVVTPTSPKVFDEIYFYGAEEGQQLTLHAGCSIVPRFGAAAGYGEVIKFKDVANHDFSQAELLEALAQMFNLRIYSHRPSKRVFIEPYDDFYQGEEVDWREYQLDDDQIIEECATESFMATTLGYQPSDAATKRLTSDVDGEFGRWSISQTNYAAKRSIDRRLNPLFSATATMAGVVGAAPSAEVLVVGNRDTVEPEEYVSPRIALYYGIQPLGEEERWPLPIECDGYPMLAFHAPKQGQTLCFEDRDGCEGLHRYYDNELRELQSRQYLTTKIALSAIRYAALFDPDAEGGNFRSRFRLRVGENSSLFRLDEILSYDAEEGVARCRFRRMLCD